MRPSLIVGIVVLLVFVAPPSQGHRGPGGELIFDDDIGDVQTRPGDVQVNNPEASNADLQRIRIFNESGLDFELEVNLVGMGLPAATGESMSFHACFELAGVPVVALASYRLDSERITPEYGFAWRMAEPDCKAEVRISDAGSSRQSPVNLGLAIERETSTLRLVLPKKPLARIVDNASLSPGAILTKFVAYTTYAKSLSVKLHDMVPNGGPSDERYEFRQFMSNEELVVEAHPTLVKYGGSCLGYDAPRAIVEASGFQGVPLVLVNNHPASLIVNLTAHTHMPGWTAQVIPQLTLPGSEKGASGRLPLTLVVAAQAEHQKQCGWIQVSAEETGNPSRRGEVFVEVVASKGLDVNRKTLHFHWARYGTGNLSYPFSLNTYRDDPSANQEFRKKLTYPMQGAASLLSMNPYEFSSMTDTVYPFNVLLAAGQAAEATLFLESDGVPTNVRMSVGLRSGRDLLAYGEWTGAIPSGGKEIVVPMPVISDAWRSGTRALVANEPIIVDVRYEPTGLVAGPLPPGAGASMVWFTAGRSHVTLPVVDVQRTNTLGVGEAGGFVTIRLDETNQTKLVSPSRAAIFNFSLTNEATEVDEFRINANVTVTAGKGWLARPVDGKQTTGALKPAETRRVSVAVVAPMDAPAGAEAQVVVEVVGGRDGARASALGVARVVMDQVAGVGTEALSGDAAPKATPGTPATWLMATLAAVVFAFAPRRR